MATTYLTLVNNVLNELNESELTSATFANSRGVQTSVKKFVLKAMHEIYSTLQEVPDLYISTKQDTQVGQRVYDLPTANSPQTGDAEYRKIDYDTFRIVPKELVTNGEFTSNITSWTTGSGTPAYNSGGNGRLRLNAAAAYQSLSTVKNVQYRLQVRLIDSSSSGGNLKVLVGTSAEASDVLNETLAVTDFGAGNILNTTFTATAATTFITLDNDNSTNLDVDYVRISEDAGIKKLKYITYDNWASRFLETDLENSSEHYGLPQYVYTTQDKKFGLHPIPDKDTYTVEYEYWKVHTDLSAATDTMDLNDRFKDVIITRAKYYTYVLRSDPQAAQMALAEYKLQLQILRSEYINTKAYMRDTRVHVNA